EDPVLMSIAQIDLAEPSRSAEALALLPRGSRWRSARRLMRTQPLGAAGLAIILALVLMAAFAPLLAPYDPTNIDGRSLQSPSSEHFFGTDDKGRDVLSRVIYGSRTSLEVGIIATFVG